MGFLCFIYFAEVMKGLGAKKLAKWKQQQSGDVAEKPDSDFEGVRRRNDVEMTKQVDFYFFHA